MHTRRLLWQIYPSHLLVTLVCLAGLTWYASAALRQFAIQRSGDDLTARALLAAEQFRPMLAARDFAAVDGHAATFYWDMKVDDNAFLSLRTAAGQTAWLHVSCTEWKNMFSLELYGRDGKISVDGLGGSYGTERLTYHRMLPQMGPPETATWEFPGKDGSWAAETAAFVEDIRGARTPSPGLREGIRVLEIVESIYKKSGYPTP